MQRMTEEELDEMEQEVERLSNVLEKDPSDKVAARELLRWLQRNEDNLNKMVYGH